MQIVAPISILDGWTPLIAYSSPANSTTVHNRVVLRHKFMSGQTILFTRSAKIAVSFESIKQLLNPSGLECHKALLQSLFHDLLYYLLPFRRWKSPKRERGRTDKQLNRQTDIASYSMAAGLWPKAVSQINPLPSGGWALVTIGSALSCRAAVLETLQATAGRRQMAGNTFANWSLEYAKLRHN